VLPAGPASRDEETTLPEGNQTAMAAQHEASPVPTAGEERDAALTEETIMAERRTNQPIVAPESKDSPVPSAGVEMGAALTEEDMMAKTPMNQPTVAPESEVSPVPSAGEDGDPLVEPEVPANRAAHKPVLESGDEAFLVASAGHDELSPQNALVATPHATEPFQIKAPDDGMTLDSPLKVTSKSTMRLRDGTGSQLGSARSAFSEQVNPPRDSVEPAVQRMEVPETNLTYDTEPFQRNASTVPSDANVAGLRRPL